MMIMGRDEAKCRVVKQQLTAFRRHGDSPAAHCIRTMMTSMTTETETQMIARVTSVDSAYCVPTHQRITS